MHESSHYAEFTVIKVVLISLAHRKRLAVN